MWSRASAVAVWWTGSLACSPGGGSGGSAEYAAGGSSALGGSAASGGGAIGSGQAAASGASVGGSVGAGGRTTDGGSEASGGLGTEALGPAELGEGELDAASEGGTLTFQNLGKPGFYPTRREPGTSPCDVYSNGSCCMTRHELKDDRLTPWNEELIVSLRGPMQIKQFIVYSADDDDSSWRAASAWDSSHPEEAFGIAFDGNATKGAKFAGTVGSECVTDVMTDEPFPCGPGSVPYCPSGGTKNFGWNGSKLFVLLARMPMMGGPNIDPSTACGTGTGNGWYNAPWIGLSVGELIREGKFGDCNCYGRTPADWYAGDGCGQINAFEVVNDNNAFQNFDLFSSNIFAYYGNVGEGPCGRSCSVSGVGPADLIDKTTSAAAREAGVTTFGGSAAHVAFRRPTGGYRYVLALLDVKTRQMQLAIIHPRNVPAAAADLLPALPRTLGRATIDSLLAMRLPG